MTPRLGILIGLLTVTAAIPLAASYPVGDGEDGNVLLRFEPGEVRVAAGERATTTLTYENAGASPLFVKARLASITRGWSTDFESHRFTLQPGETRAERVTLAPPADAPNGAAGALSVKITSDEGDYARATFRAHLARDDATVPVEPSPPVAPLSARFEPERAHVEPGEAVTTTLRYENRGVEPTCFTSHAAELTAGWETTLAPARRCLAPGESMRIGVKLLAPDDAEPASRGHLVAVARTDGGENARAEFSAEVTGGPVRPPPPPPPTDPNALEARFDPGIITLTPGGWQSSELVLTNLAYDWYCAKVYAADIRPGWHTDLAPRELCFGPHQQIRLVVQVRAPDGAGEHEDGWLYAEALAPGRNTARAGLRADVVVEARTPAQPEPVEVRMREEAAIARGDSASTQVSVENRASTTVCATVHATTASDGWRVVFETRHLCLAPGATTTMPIKLVPPEHAAEGDVGYTHVVLQGDGAYARESFTATYTAA